MNFEISPKSTEIQANWYEAKLYCFSLGEGWRLPTKEELYEICYSNNDFDRDWYWSSNELIDLAAWIQNMDNGVRYHRNKHSCYFVRAIRDLKDN